MSVLKNLNLHRKLLLIVGWAALSMALLIALSLYNRWHQTLEEPKTLALSLVEVANGVIDRYQRQEQAGALTREQAQKLSIETLRNMRYQDLYFVIVDQDQRLLLHATRPELENQAARGGRDANALAAITAEMIDVALMSGHDRARVSLSPRSVMPGNSLPGTGCWPLGFIWMRCVMSSSAQCCAKRSSRSSCWRPC
jgi:hypothetical protein